MSELNASNIRKERGNEGPDLVGVTELTSSYYMVPPSGTTAERPQNPEPGTLRFNTDIGRLEYFKGDTLGWETIQGTSPNLSGAATSGSIDGTGARAIFAGGFIAGSPANPCFNNVDALTIATLGNTIDFNNLTASLCGGFSVGDSTRAIHAGGMGPSSHPGPAVDSIQYATFSSQGDFVDGGDLTGARAAGAALCDSTRGLAAGKGYPGYSATIDYWTMQSTGNALDFGDVHTAKGWANGLMSSTRGLIAGGIYCCPGVAYNNIEYVTIQTTGDAVDFGDMTAAKYETGPMGNATRGILAAGSPTLDVIEYITISTLGNATDFGDLDSLNGSNKYSASSPTRGVVGGGYSSPTPYTNIIEYIQIATLGNSKDFGDFINFERRSGSGHGGISNAHGGL